VTGAKMFFLTENHFLTQEDIVTFAMQFHNDTGLTPTCIKITGWQWFTFLKAFHNNHTLVATELNHPVVLKMATPWGYIPIVNIAEDKQHKHGYVVVEDSNFDKEFEKIVLEKSK